MTASPEEQKKKPETEEKKGDDESFDKFDEESVPEYLKLGSVDALDTTTTDEIQAALASVDEGGTSSTAVVIGKKVRGIAHFLAQLSLVGSKAEIDNLSEAFCYINSKNARRKLAVFLGTVHRDHMNRFPFFGRLVATLHKGGINVSDRLVVLLETDFYRLAGKKV